MIQWTNLTGCYGSSVQNPTERDLKLALSELFGSKNNEHPDAWINCGTENGPLYSLSVFSSGYAIYTKFSNADMDKELEQKRIESVTEESAFYLWKALIDNEHTKI